MSGNRHLREAPPCSPPPWDGIPGLQRRYLYLNAEPYDIITGMSRPLTVAEENEIRRILMPHYVLVTIYKPKWWHRTWRRIVNWWLDTAH